MPDEQAGDYLNRLKVYALYAAAILIILVLQALITRFIGSGTLPPPPPPVIVVSPDQPVSVTVYRE
jgi:hypothetical protein